MSEEVYLTLPYPAFFTPKLLEYLEKVSEVAGREIEFCDGRPYGPQLKKAKTFPHPEWPASAIVIIDPAFKQTTYDPTAFDPIVAHEAGHIELHGEGWPQIDWGKINYFENALKKILVD